MNGREGFAIDGRPAAVLRVLAHEEAIAIGRVATAHEHRGKGLAGRLMGSYIAPESGAALAAVRALVERGDVGADEDVVVFDCGIGQKYPPPPGLV